MLLLLNNLLIFLFCTISRIFYSSIIFLNVHTIIIIIYIYNIIWLRIRHCASVRTSSSSFFFQRRKENAFTHAVWDSAEAIPTKLKTPLFPRQTMTP